MAQKTITAVIVDASFSESFTETSYGEQFVASVELQISDVDTGQIYVKKLTDADLCDITNIEKTFTPLEIIKIAEHLRKFTQPIELIVDDKTHLISNEMIKMGAEEENDNKPPVKKVTKPTSTQRKRRQTPQQNKNFGFNPEKASEALASRQRKKQTET